MSRKDQFQWAAPRTSGAPARAIMRCGAAGFLGVAVTASSAMVSSVLAAEGGARSCLLGSRGPGFECMNQFSRAGAQHEQRS